MPAEIEQLLQRAVAHHQAGQFDEAERCYRDILLTQPGHPEANHNIGALALARQQPMVALPHFLKALEADPARGQYWLSYADALFQAGQPDAAREVLRMAKSNGLQGDGIAALEARFNVAAHAAKPQTVGKAPSQQQIDALIALFNQRRYTEAAGAARTLTELYPAHSFGWSTLGVVLQQMGRNDEALPALQKAVALAPRDAQAHSNLGNTLSYLGRLNEAEASFRHALKLDKNFAEAHLNLGATLHDLGRFAEAEQSYRRALQLKPGLADAHYNLGNTLKSQDKLEEAVASFHKALQIAPGLLGAANNLGAALQAQGKLADAETILRNVLQSNPDSLEAYSNLGSTLHDMGRLEEAKAEYEKALRLKPDHAEILSNLGITLMTMGQQDEAVRCFRDALKCKPDYLKARSNLLFSLNYSSGASPEDCLAEARRYGEIVSGKVAEKFTRWSVAMQPKRLRIGLVSADLRNHPVGYFLESVLGQLAASSSVELFAYPTFHKSDELTARIKRHFFAWRPIHGMSDAVAARLIHDDKIHILIDLSGHTRLNRLPLFAWKPAPVQATWLGYFATTGVAEIDYIIGDPHVSPTSESAHFSENIWQLPECYWCFSAPDSQVEVSALPALQAGHITFGCFNNLSKMNDAVVALWAKILSAIPGAKLFLKYSQLNDAAVREATLQRYAMHGIGADRLILEGPSPRAEYLASYHRVDIALDPFPYPGGTTSMESLWMGVPVLTKRGDRFLAHAGETINCNAGLGAWVATDGDDYLAKAVSFSADLSQLAALRAGLRSQVLSSPIFDASRFAGHFEKALWGMWEKWLAQENN